MPRKAGKLLKNDREVKAAKPPKPRASTNTDVKTYEVAEYRIEGATNLILRVAPSGRRGWVYRFRRPRTGKWAKLAIGQYPAVGLADAKKEATRLLRMVVDGEDPIDARHGRGAIPTFADLGAEYINRHAKPKKRSWQEDERQLKKNVYPTLGDIRADLVTRDDVRKLLDAIEDRGAPIAANRTLAVVRKVYNWANSAGRLDVLNPAAKMGLRGKEEARERSLSDAEIRELWEALDDANGFDDVTADALRLQLIMGARISEITGMRRSDLNLEGGRLIWRVPRARAKKDKHIVRPLGPLAVAIIRNRLDATDSKYVFASPFDDDAPLGAKVPTRAIERAARLGLVPSGFSSHDLRRTCATMWAKLGIPEQISRKLLGHAAKRTDTLGRHYDQYEYRVEMLQALRKWERRLLRITAPRDLVADGLGELLPAAA